MAKNFRVGSVLVRRWDCIRCSVVWRVIRCDDRGVFIYSKSGWRVRLNGDPWDSKSVEDDDWSSRCKFQIQFKEATDSRLTLRSIGKLYWKISLYYRFALHIWSKQTGCGLTFNGQERTRAWFQICPSYYWRGFKSWGYGGCIKYELSPWYFLTYSSDARKINVYTIGLHKMHWLAESSPQPPEIELSLTDK